MVSGAILERWTGLSDPQVVELVLSGQTVRRPRAVLETIAAWPVLGRLTYDALRARDIPLVAGCALAGPTVLAIGLFVSDVLTAWADPRVRLGA